MQQAVIFCVFFGFYIGGVYLLVGSSPAEGDEQDSFVLGLVLFTVTSLINIWYLYLEFREMVSNGVGYFSSVQNVFDLLSIVNIIALAPLIFTGHPLAHLFGSLGTMLMIPKMAAMVRPQRATSRHLGLRQPAL